MGLFSKPSAHVVTPAGFPLNATVEIPEDEMRLGSLAFLRQRCAEAGL